MSAVPTFVLRLQKLVSWWYAYFATWCNPSYVNNKQLRNKQIIGIDDIASPDLHVASYAERFRGNYC